MSGVSSETRRGFSWLLMSVEATGVGGRVGRGMAGCVDERVLPPKTPTPRSIQHKTMQSITGKGRYQVRGRATKGKTWNGT
jgi:hypothetical protein